MIKTNMMKCGTNSQGRKRFQAYIRSNSHLRHAGRPRRARVLRQTTFLLRQHWPTFSLLLRSLRDTLTPSRLSPLLKIASPTRHPRTARERSTAVTLVHRVAHFGARRNVTIRAGAVWWRAGTVVRNGVREDERGAEEKQDGGEGGKMHGLRLRVLSRPKQV